MGKSKVVCVDFDGTCVMHEYPKIGEDVPNAVNVLKKLNENQVKIILWTIRSGEFLQEAVNWFVERDIQIWAVNKNPQQRFWSNHQRFMLPFILTMPHSAAH